MSETHSPRQLPTAVAKAPRRLLAGGVTGLVALGGAAFVAAAPAAQYMAGAPTAHAPSTTHHVLAVSGTFRHIDQD